MGAIVSRIIAIGKNQIGVAENPLGSNRTKYGVFWDTPKSKNGPYPWFNGKKNGECGWCCMYSLWESTMGIKDILGWDYDKIRVWLGLPKNPADNAGAGAPHLYKYFKAKGWEIDKTKGQPGDYIFFNTSLGKCSHVGRIDSISGGKYKTVEGNKSNKVGQGTYTISNTNGNIYAVIHIPYETIEPAPDPSQVTYTVATKYQPLTLRKEPTTKSDAIGELAKGSTFTSSTVVKGEDVKGCDAWVEVNSGYANGYYLSPTPVVTDPEPDPLPHPEPEPPKPVIQTYKIKTNTGASLALRAAPNTKAACIVWMPNKSEVTVSGFVTGQKIGSCDQWARTTYKGKSGYCLSKYLTKA